MRSKRPCRIGASSPIVRNWTAFVAEEVRFAASLRRSSYEVLTLGVRCAFDVELEVRMSLCPSSGCARTILPCKSGQRACSPVLWASKMARRPCFRDDTRPTRRLGGHYEIRMSLVSQILGYSLDTSQLLRARLSTPQSRRRREARQAHLCRVRHQRQPVCLRHRRLRHPLCRQCQADPVLRLHHRCHRARPSSHPA